MAATFDRIGYWSEIKLEIVKKYAAAYSQILAPRFHHAYIDAFAGYGMHYSRTTKMFVPGSPKIALDITPPFREYYFIEISPARVEALKTLASNRQDVHVLQGDCNVRLLADVFPNVKWQQYRRGLCLLDPYGLDLNWDVIQTAGEMKTIDMFLNFPVMDMNRNVLWTDRAGVGSEAVSRMNRYWGDSSWESAAYRQTRDMFGDTRELKETNRDIAMAFGERLRAVAGFAEVSEPLPMRNSRGAVVYYLFFASQQPLALDIVAQIFGKYRERGMK